MATRLTTLGLRGMLCQFATLAVAWLLLSAPAGGQSPSPDSAASAMPILFDRRERLPRPDLSGLLRFRFLTSTDFPPFNFADQTGRLSGFHVDLVRAICGELGLEAKCQIQALPFGELQNALETGQAEAVIAGVAVTEAQRRRFEFSRPYMMLPARFVRNRGVELPGGDLHALQGRRVGVVAATAHEAMFATFFPQLKAVPFDDRASLLDAVKAGSVDAAFADALQLSFWTNSKASENCCALFEGPYFSERFLGEGLSVLLRKDERQLTEAIDSALAALSAKGSLQEIYLRYFPYDLYGRADAGTPGGQPLR